MNGNDRKIEILTPFNLALQWTRQVLFRPFDLEKWLVIGFAAFLSHLAGGGGTGFNFNPASFRNRGNWDFRTTSHNFYPTSDHVSPWLILFVTTAILVIMIAVILVLLWIGCRGRFIFVDCVVRNRGAIKEPWGEFREVANSFFGFLLAVILLFVVIVLVAGSPFILWLVLHHGDVNFGPAIVLGLGLWIAFVFIFALAWGLISQFMIVTMYRRRCGAVEAFRSTVSLVMSDPVPFILYVLFLFVLSIFVAMISCIATCVTCCVAAIPYVGTVILLPLYVFLAAYPLLFARQFGLDWDAWANLTPPNLGLPSTPPAPPVQSAPPPGQSIPETPPSVEPQSGSRSPYEPPGTSPPPPPSQS